MEPVTGFEPVAFPLRRDCSTTELYRRFYILSNQLEAFVRVNFVILVYNYFKMFRKLNILLFTITLVVIALFVAYIDKIL